jgi:hypothetical protein
MKRKQKQQPDLLENSYNTRNQKSKLKSAAILNCKIPNEMAPNTDHPDFKTGTNISLDKSLYESSARTFSHMQFAMREAQHVNK